MHAAGSTIVAIITELKEINAILAQRTTDFDNISQTLTHLR